MNSTIVGRVAGLWRYPVKSMGGQTLTRAEVGEDGIVGDRAFGVVDAVTGHLLSAKRVPQLLAATALHRDDGHVDIVLPIGAEGSATSSSVSSDDADIDQRLSSWLGREVRLERPQPDRSSTIEIETDLDDPSVVHRFSTLPGRFFDSRSVLHLVTPASLRSATALHPSGRWALARFRPNVVVETPEGAQGWVEDAWVGATMELGNVAVRGRKQCERCVITTREQPGLERDLEILRTLAAFHDASLGIYLDVVGAGTVSVGDDLVRDDAEPPA